jgi:hypothetical protein
MLLAPLHELFLFVNHQTENLQLFLKMGNILEIF